MHLVNHTPFPAITFPATDRHRQSVHVVVVRATFRIHADGTVTIADKQQPIVMTDEYFGELNRSSVRQESDLVPEKPRCDVIVNAIAHAPGGIPTSAFLVGITIEKPTRESEHRRRLLDKTLLITAPRHWEYQSRKGWVLTAPAAPIRSLPLRYEYAAGGECRVELEAPAAGRLTEEQCLGPEQRAAHPQGPKRAPRAHAVCETNPLGLGFSTAWYLAAAAVRSVPAPQILEPSQTMPHHGDDRLPQGFGIIAKTWQPRRQLAGTYDEQWRAAVWPHLPEDFEPSFWNGAHPDLQLPYLEGGEMVTLTNLTPDGTLTFTVPTMAPTLEVRYKSGRTAAQPARLDTLLIEPDALTCVLVWRTTLPTQQQPVCVQASYADVIA